MMSATWEKQADGAKGAQRGDFDVPLGKTENLSRSTMCLSWTWKEQYSNLESWVFGEETVAVDLGM